jgi:hypothetical protein
MLKKISKSIFPIMASLGGFLATVPVLVLAAGLVNCKSDPCTWSDLFTLMNDVIHFLIFDLGLPLITIIIVWSGIELVWYRNSSAYEKAKSRLSMALFGLVIMLAAYLIVKAIVFGLTSGGDVYNLKSQFK